MKKQVKTKKKSKVSTKPTKINRIDNRNLDGYPSVGRGDGDYYTYGCDIYNF